jgi:hypothetical protein
VPFKPAQLRGQRADVAAKNPLAWIIEVNGLAVDARRVPFEIQVKAFQCKRNRPRIRSRGGMC